MVTKNPRRRIDAHLLHQQLRDNGGFSVSLEGNPPRSGTMVSREGTEEVVPGVASPSAIDDYVTQHEHLLTRGRYIGGWVDTDGDPVSTYLDVSDRWADPVGAKNAAAANHQLSRYEVDTGRVVDTTEPTLFPLEPNVDPPRHVIRHRSQLLGKSHRDEDS